MEVSSQHHSPVALPQRNSTRNPLDRRLDGPQDWFGRGGEQKNILLLPGLETTLVQPVARRSAIMAPILIKDSENKLRR
jgi:hypothetical protein